MKKEKVVAKEYYRIVFRLASPLMIGSGYNRYTDSDVLRNGKGIPYIPGSAVAGVCIHALELNKEEREKYFGTWFDMENQTPKDSNGRVTLEESKVLFYDANILKEDEKKHYVSKRDCVSLDDWKVAKKGAKFDMEILEPNVRMVTYIEQNLFEGDTSVLDRIAAVWLSENISFGAKTMRGFGEIEEVEIQRKTFDLTQKENLEQWLEFDLYQDNMWEKEPILQKKDLPAPKQRMIKQLTLDLEQVGGISIRTYTTAVQKDANANPDSEQLLVHNKDSEVPVPVIPGTSWAGAFLKQMKSLGLKEEVKEAVFGKVDEKKKEKQKSKIRFSETQLRGAEGKILSRNAIDRFTGGTIDTALFTEKTYYGGTTQLKIELEENVDQTVKKTLAAAIVDLQNGFMAVGGLTAIGRGLFHVKKVNGELIDWEKPEQAYQRILEMLQKNQEEVV